MQTISACHSFPNHTKVLYRREGEKILKHWTQHFYGL